MKFKVLEKITKDIKDRIENQKVCDVVEHVFSVPTGTFKGWTGSVEEAYFSITFVKGVIALSLSEREACLGWEIISYAVVEPLHQALIGKTPLSERKEFVRQYNTTGHLKDSVDITFNDVMIALNWKFKSRKVKVKYAIV